MRLFAISDLHVDFRPNFQWVEHLSQMDFTEDTVIVAGDISDNSALLAATFELLLGKFKQVVFVPGNHELWVVRDDIKDSLKKFALVLQLAQERGVITKPVILGEFEILPLFSWYDYSFAPLNEKIQQVWSDFSCCQWPMRVEEVAAHFHRLNPIAPIASTKIRVSVSHFLPTLKVLPAYIPSQYDYLWPVLGATALGEQVKALSPRFHVYGHSHVNTVHKLDGVVYINNALGYPRENRTQAELIQIDTHRIG